MTAKRTCRWGILGAAGIARKNWQAIRHAGNAELVAVASRDAARARGFIAACQTLVPHPVEPVAAASYDELLARDDIDAVYIPLRTAVRAAWAVRAAERGKHVLIEKPCGTGVAELERIIAACRQADVQFMDGTMFLHGRRIEAVRAHLDPTADDGVGAIRRIVSQFSFRGDDAFLTDDSLRSFAAVEPLGCLGDLGWYPIAFVLWALAPRLPDAVSGRLVAAIEPAGGGASMPVEFCGELVFHDPPAVTASFFCSFLVEHQQWVHVSGTRGSLRIDDFVLPSAGSAAAFTVSRPSFTTDGCEFRMEQHDRVITVAEEACGGASAQETRMFEAFSAAVLAGRREDRWPQASLATQQVLMACLDDARRRVGSTDRWVDRRSLVDPAE